MRIAGRLFVAVLLATGPARATGPGNKAEESFQQARRLMAQGKIAEACPLFEESQRLAPGLGTLLNLGGCYEADGRLLHAYRTYVAVERQARASKRPDREKEAHDRAAAVGAKVALLVVRADPAAPAYTITSDGEPIELPPPGEPIALAPGPHVVVIKSGATVYDQRLDLAAGSTKTVDLAALSTTPAPAAAAPASAAPASAPPAGTAPESPQGPSSSSTARIAGYAALGVGVLGVGLGSVFALRAKSTYGDSDAHCPARGCDAEGLSLVSSARTSGNVATASFIVGAAGLTTGILLLLYAPSSSSRAAVPASSWSLSPEMARRGAGLRVIHAF